MKFRPRLCTGSGPLAEPSPPPPECCRTAGLVTGETTQEQRREPGSFSFYLMVFRLQRKRRLKGLRAPLS